MKINPGEKLQQSMPSPLLRAKTAPKSSAFAEVLQKTVEPNPSANQVVQPAMQSVMRPILTAAFDEAYLATDRMLDAMERYQHLLSDTKVGLRTVEPAVQQLKKEVTALTPLLEQIPADNPIKRIAQEALITASKEIARFDGGEYVDQ